MRLDKLCSICRWLSALGTRQSSRVLVDEQFGSLAVVDEFDRECRSYQGQIFVSELGCGGMADLDEQVAGFNGKEDLLDAFRNRPSHLLAALTPQIRAGS